MLKRLAFCALLTLPATLHAAETNVMKSSGNLNWSTQKSWKMDAAPVAFVQSLDNKKTFVLGADAKVHIFDTNGKELGALPVSADVIDIDIAPRGEILYLLNKEEKSFTALNISFTQDIDVSTAPILGNPDAPVTLVEFSDFECPYCSKVKPILDKLLKANPNTVKVAFKHLPLRMHPQAETAALASIAAQKQGKFWEMHDELFKTKKISAQTIEASAQKIGLNMEQFNKDKEATATRQQLARDLFEAQKAEITGTPTLFINGVRVKSRSLQDLQAMVDQALEKSSAK
ncbi:thioredoxin domain-containing protein [Desulfogranum marinum]|uniref:thioredoxin domain-containing protein n=1 Tax=Desulfogranum marinum TaxID=453220 RepID=UPI001964DAF2|nr:thioredoxin domain-containing protein [Desulfogranum marinum]MBM9512526.1 thioredoxin domain-containing protein [Desulfogranum marinum]